jgi:hypothetical protein
MSKGKITMHNAESLFDLLPMRMKRISYWKRPSRAIIDKIK